MIDGDELAYRVFFSRGPCTDDENIDRFLSHIISVTKCDFVKIVLGDKTTFRHRLATILPYKGNRKTKHPDIEKIKRLLIDEFGAFVMPDMEADDGLSLHQRDQTVVVSIDKDLDQVSGLRMRGIDATSVDCISTPAAIAAFYRQMLTGDRDDNVPGIYGFGKKKAEVLIPVSRYLTPHQSFQIVLDEYKVAVKDERNPYYGKSPEETVVEIGSLLWLQRPQSAFWSTELPF